MPKPAPQRKPFCPQCGRSEAVVRIVYGLPNPSLDKSVREAQVVFGGYVAGEDAPAWYCDACRQSFGEADAA